MIGQKVRFNSLTAALTAAQVYIIVQSFYNNSLKIHPNYDLIHNIYLKNLFQKLFPTVDLLFVCFRILCILSRAFSRVFVHVYSFLPGFRRRRWHFFSLPPLIFSAGSQSRLVGRAVYTQTVKNG